MTRVIVIDSCCRLSLSAQILISCSYVTTIKFTSQDTQGLASWPFGEARPLVSFGRSSDRVEVNIACRDTLLL